MWPTQINLTLPVVAVFSDDGGGSMYILPYVYMACVCVCVYVRVVNLFGWNMQSCRVFQNVMLYICYNVDSASDEVLISANSNYTRGVISVQLAKQSL